MIVKQIDDATLESYEAFVRARPETLFYYGSAYRQLLRDLLSADERTLVAIEAGEVRGVLPLLSFDGPAGRVFNSLPYYGSNGGIVASSAGAERALVQGYGEFARAPETLASTVVANPFGPPTPDGLLHNLLDERIAQFTPIPSDGNLLERIAPSARRNIEKARRLGYEVAADPSALPRLHELHEANIRMIGGRPKEVRFFHLVAERLTPTLDYDVWVARHDGTVVAALLVLYWGRVVEYFTPAIDHAHRSAQPLSLILIEAMGEAARRGYEIWNWGGTWLSQTTLYRFKAKWGAREQRYSYLVQLNDKSILDWSPSAILDAYPNFYVVPFRVLREASSQSS